MPQSSAHCRAEKHRVTSKVRPRVELGELLSIYHRPIIGLSQTYHRVINHHKRAIPQFAHPVLVVGEALGLTDGVAQIDQRGASWWWEDRKQKRERNFPFELARAAMQIQVLMAGAGVGIVEKWRRSGGWPCVDKK